MFTTGLAEITHLVQNVKRTIQTQLNSEG